MNSPLVNFSREEDGATAVEYAVMLALILMAMFGTILFFGTSAGGSFGNISQKIDTFFSGAGL